MVEAAYHIRRIAIFLEWIRFPLLAELGLANQRSTVMQSSKRFSFMKNAPVYPIYIASFLPMVFGLTHSAIADEVTKQAKIIIEHNATDKDTGFQLFVDAEGWEKMQVVGPNGTIAEFNAHGPINDLGMTELFLETVEPENNKTPLQETLKKMPEGRYQFVATASRSGGAEGLIKGEATLSHKIPGGVTLLVPKEGASIPVTNTRMSWQPSDKPINGTGLKLIAYQLIIEKDEEPQPRMIGKRGMSMYLPPTVTILMYRLAFLNRQHPTSGKSWQ
jgi:hypothetical protein